MNAMSLVSLTPTTVDAGAATPLLAAKAYLARGWWPVPVQPKSKQCQFSGWPSLKLTEPELANHFSGNGNIGINLGPSGLTDIDVDSPLAHHFLGWLPPTNAVWGRAGNPGSHHLYLGDRKPRSYKNTTGVILERRSGNQYAVLPPSVHPEGVPYVWEHEGEPGNGDGLEFAEVKIAIASTLLPYWKSGFRHHMALGTAGLLLKAGWPVGDVAHLIVGVAKAAGDPDVADRVSTVNTTATQMKEGVPVAGASMIIPIIGDTNVQAITSWLPSTGQESVAATKAPLLEYAMTLSELCALELPEIEYLLDPFLAKESLNMLFAARGVGKTWFTQHLALCLARGVDFFAWPVPEPRRVLLVDGEMPLSHLQFRLKALLGTEPLPPNLCFISVATMWQKDDSLAINRADDQARIEQLLAALEAKGERPDLIIFDNLSSLMVGVDENSNSELDGFLRWQIKLRSRGYAVLCVHHAGKNNEQRGASRREDLLDTVIKLVAAESIGLVPADGACFDIEFTKTRGERPNPNKLRVALVKDDDGPFQWNIEDVQHQFPAYIKVVQAIQTHKPVTQVALAALLKVKKQAVNKQIKIAKKKGLVDGSGIALTPKGNAYVNKLFPADTTGFDDSL